MSHCTKFDFQYTSRKIICRTFQTLGLNWRDDVVATYSSTLMKILDIGGKDEILAIVAKRDGFQYFMMNMGAYYELLIERHNMTSSEANISKQMAKMQQEDFKDLRDWANENAVSASVSISSGNSAENSLGGRKIDLL